MSNLSPTKLNRSNERPTLLIWALLLSLLLHIAVVLFFIFFPQQENLKLKRPPVTVVQLIDLPPVKAKKPQPEKKSEFEIDQKPVKTPPPTPVESFRKADQDQKVKKEQAPEADDTRDLTMKRPVTKLPQQPKPQPEVQPAPAEIVPVPPEVKPVQPEAKPAQPQKPAPAKKQQQPKKPLKSIRKAKVEQAVKQEKVKETPQPAETRPAPPPKPAVAPRPAVAPKPPLSMEQLLPNSNTLNRITQGTQADRNRRKKREGVEIGDEVWLDLQQNWLTSFFRRLHDKIDAVWNYPSRAARNGIEGTLELLIVVNKKGELLDVDLVQSSGSDILDNEAILAIYRAAPFGPITKRYPHEVLKIHANFRYKIGGRYIF